MKQSAKRILILHSSNDMYGASRIALQVIDILIQAKYEVHVILPTKGVAKQDNYVIKEPRAAHII